MIAQPADELCCSLRDPLDAAQQGLDRAQSSSTQAAVALGQFVGAAALLCDVVDAGLVADFFFEQQRQGVCQAPNTRWHGLGVGGRRPRLGLVQLALELVEDFLDASESV